jgi:hypothetical protein
MSDNCLLMADTIVSGNRRNDYGTPLENHSRTARLWSAYLKRTVSAEDVCMLNILQKISRGMHSITPDTLVDICGYARNIQIIQNERQFGAKAVPDAYNKSPKSDASYKNPEIPSSRPIPCCGVGSDCQEMREMPDVQTGWGVPPNWKSTPVVL